MFNITVRAMRIKHSTEKGIEEKKKVERFCQDKNICIGSFANGNFLAVAGIANDCVRLPFLFLLTARHQEHVYHGDRLLEYECAL